MLLACVKKDAVTLFSTSQSITHINIVHFLIELDALHLSCHPVNQGLRLGMNQLIETEIYADWFARLRDIRAKA